MMNNQQPIFSEAMFNDIRFCTHWHQRKASPRQRANRALAPPYTQQSLLQQPRRRPYPSLDVALLRPGECDRRDFRTGKSIARRRRCGRLPTYGGDLLPRLYQCLADRRLGFRSQASFLPQVTAR
jgi:hypothetical protein